MMGVRLDKTTLNSKSMHWLEKVTRLSTGTSSALDACQLLLHNKHPLHQDGIMFHVIVNIIQLSIMHNEPLFHVEYAENDFHSTGINIY